MTFTDSSGKLHKDKTIARVMRAMLFRHLTGLKRGIAALLAFLALMALVCLGAAVSMSRGSSGAYVAARVALVDEESSIVSNLAVEMISRQEFTSAISIERCWLDAAMVGLADGTYSAIIMLPDGYTDDIMHGSEGHARVILSADAAVHSEVVRVLSQMGEDLLASGQIGIFAGESLVYQADPSALDAFLLNSNMTSIADAFSSDWFSELEVPYGATGVDAATWYGLLYASLFMWMSALIFLPLRKDVNGPFLRRLGGSRATFVFWLSSFIMQLALRLILAAACCVILHISGVPIKVTAGAACALLALTFVFSLVGTALTLSLPQNTSASIITVLGALGLIASGGIVPRTELPGFVLRLGDFLPVGFGAQLMKGLCGGTRLNVACWLAALIWSVAAILLLNLSLASVRTGKGGKQ